ncbi:Asp-tRNA(Asn)/Glu-tRNA(Gln) amidotransferase subunit GatB [Agaribacterium sp. ZY112]|uniref:Asp-tRNA(Asn)/Glu-tRNA(Gln) amidotransferase subunit GatB n=1 Tax=Agaribacterium sp. ZY112 TaxID=3233574 RepID=UPI003525AB2B
MQWETVIGLEIHVQLNTHTKIFSGSSIAFGAEPNTQASLVDLAMPGTLPVANEEAFRKAIMFGLAVDAEIGTESVFERKNYFYPDLPKGYQTTQLDKPIVIGGHLDIQVGENTKRVRLHHAHLEEDAGKSLHEDFHGMSGIDLNRAGTPLIEVVTEPDISNAEEAVAFARKMHSLVSSLGICDGEMSQGSMRFDVNISVRPAGEEKLGTRTETKNLNSFRFMERCIEQEVERQIEVLEDGGSITQETRLYNGDTHTARSMRSKEEANDYRYFPCPDLLPVHVDEVYIEAVKQSLPELPEARKQRFEEQYKLSSYDADLLSADASMAKLFESCTETSKDAKLSANWLMGEFSARLNTEELSINHAPINGEQLGTLIVRIKDGTISNKIAKTVFDAMWNGEGEVDSIIEAKGLKQVSDSGALEKIVDDVIAANDKQVENYRAAAEDKKPKMLGFFVGQCMKASKGQANPQQLNKILKEKLG